MYALCRTRKAPGWGGAQGAGAHPRPMTVAITCLDPAGADRAELIALLTGSAWPFPVRPHITRPVAKEAVEDGGGHPTMLGHQLPM